MSCSCSFADTASTTKTWHTLVAPGLGLAGLVACLWLTIAKFPTLGGSPNLAAGIGAVLVLAFVLGAVWSRRRTLSAARSRVTTRDDAA